MSGGAGPYGAATRVGMVHKFRRTRLANCTLAMHRDEMVEPGKIDDGVEFEGLECAFASFLSSVGLLGVYLEVYTSRLVGCLLGELDNQLHRL